MKCYECPAKTLSGPAEQKSDFCNGPVDSELYIDSKFVLKVENVCHAIVAQRISDGIFTEDELKVSPSIKSNQKD